MSLRTDLVEVINRRLGDAELTFFGLRGDDAQGLADLHALGTVVSLVGRWEGRHSVDSFAWEDVAGVRPDLDTFDIDAELFEALGEMRQAEAVEEPASELAAFASLLSGPSRFDGLSARSSATLQLRNRLLAATAGPSAVVSHRATATLSSVVFARSADGDCRLLGLHRPLQAAFEFKPWIESIVAGMDDLPAVEWRYYSDTSRSEVSQRAESEPHGVMLRPSRSTGGVGMHHARTAQEVFDLWPEDEAGLVSVSTFHDTSVPLNVGAVVWPDGAVTLHPLSVQLIGIESAAVRPFGYCGNDFAAAAQLPPGVVETVESSTRRLGRELFLHGYRGAFGVDFLVVDGVPLFIEVNARFQGSTHLSSAMSVAIERPCILLEHVASMLGMAGAAHAEAAPGLAQLLRECPPRSHLVLHEPSEGSDVAAFRDIHERARRDRDFLAEDVVPPRHVAVDAGGVVSRVTFARAITADGAAVVVGT